MQMQMQVRVKYSLIYVCKQNRHGIFAWWSCGWKHSKW